MTTEGKLGCYAETEHAFCDTPWATDVDWSGEACEECGAHEPLSIDDLHYPVQIIVVDGGES